MRTLIERGLPMRTLKVNKNELRRRLEANLAKHKADFEEAARDYRTAAHAALAERLNQIRDAVTERRVRLASDENDDLVFKVNLNFDLEPPESHEKDYLQIIEMMKMSVEETIELSTAEFQMFVMDSWDWKSAFDDRKTLYNIRAAMVRS